VAGLIIIFLPRSREGKPGIQKKSGKKLTTEEALLTTGGGNKQKCSPDYEIYFFRNDKTSLANSVVPAAEP